jgi:capsular exopolysaccharide synthesis family protein
MAELTDSFNDLPDLEPPRPDFHLSDYWAIVVKHRRLVIACVAAAVVYGVLSTVLSRPMYRATVVLDVVRQTSNPLGMGRSVAGGEGGGDSEFLPSQIELVKSRDVAERVVRKLNLLANPDFTLQPRAGAAINSQVPPPTSEAITSAALRIKGNTDASMVRGTSLIQVSYEAPTPKLAADMANAVADAYIDWNIESRFRQIGQSAEFLATQIEQTKRDIAAKEKALLAYARQKDITEVDPKTNSSERLGGDYSVAVADRVAKEAHYRELQNTPSDAIVETTAGGMLAQIKDEQARLERDYNEKLNVYKPELPAMQQLKRQVEEGRQRVRSAVQDTATKVREAARSDYMTALRRETSIQGMMRAQQSDALNQGASNSEYSNLRTEVDTKRGLLDTLLRQQGEAEVLSRLREQQLTNIRIVDRALPPGRPFKPSASENLAIALVSGSVVGIGLALFLSYLDRSLRSGDQVETYLQLPALGAIPYSGAGGKPRGWPLGPKSPLAPGSAKSIELLPHREPRSAIAEAYRAFRTALLFSRAGGVKIVGVTSVLPQEGKSTTAVNLAIVLAQLGRRVLLVDADLHRSKIHEILDVPNRAGLVSILAEGVEPSRVIVKSGITGVFVVPAGPETPNPSGLLSSDDMRRFLELAAANFDHVIVDSPPVLATSDILVFGQYTDGVVLCVRAGQTARDQVRRVRDKLLRGGVPILGVLLSGLELGSNYYGGHEYRYLNYGERPPGSETPGPKTQASEAG